MDFVLVGSAFGIMVFVTFIYVKFFAYSGEKFIIDYSEYINETFISRANNFKGSVAKDGRSMIIKGLRGRDGKALKIERPPQLAQMPTNSPIKKIYIVKVSEGRYLYRLCDKNNESWTYKKDAEGKVIKESGKVSLVRHEWKLVDDIIEVDDKDWYESTVKDLEEKHRIQSKWDALKPVIVIAVIFIFAVIAMKFMSDNWKYMIDKSMASAEQAKSEADKVIATLNRLTGQAPAGSNEVVLNATTS